MSIPVDQLRDNLARHPGAFTQVHAICKRRGIQLAELCSDTRRLRAGKCRAECWSVLQGSLGLSDCEIGRIFGVHASTVWMAIHKREAELRGLYDAA